MAKKSDIIIKANSKTITSYELIIKKTLLIELLNKDGRVKIPEDAAVTIRVPGGGDWSNTDLELEDDITGAVIKINYNEKS